MSWPSGTVPSDVSALRDMLVASATFVAAGGVQASVHYPEVTWASVSYPVALIIRDDHDRQTYAAGSSALGSGSLRIELYFSAASGTPTGLVGSVEDVANGIAKDLGSATTGLPSRSCTAGIASDPTPAMGAASEDGSAAKYRVITISYRYEMRA